MSDSPRDPRPKANHGSPSEVSWDGGRGRQPYQNQGGQEQGPPNGGDEFEAGDRGEHSGRNLEQMEQAKGTPPD
jgi:hypothetical protein